MLEIILVLICVAVTISVVASNVYQRKNLPPGPKGLPIIGYIHKLGHEGVHITFNKLSKQYGDILSLQLGTRLAVVLSSKEAIYEAFVKKAKLFSGRPDMTTFKICSQGKTGIGCTSVNKQWQLNKTMAVRGFQHLCSNKDLVDSLITKQVIKMTDLFDNFIEHTQTFCPLDEFSKIIPAIILSIVFDDNISYNDPEFVSVVEKHNILFENAEAGHPADFFNYRIVRMLPVKRIDIIKNIRNDIIQYNMKKVNDYLSRQEKKYCLLDSYFENFYRDLTVEEITQEEIHEMGVFLADILGGGFDTVAATLSWAILYLSNHPDVTKRCREEILRVTEEETLSLRYESLLPYFVATIYDLLRHSSVAPIGVSRATTEDVQLRAFDIPKGTVVLPNIWGVNHDPKEWTRPDELYPQHFLIHDEAVDMSAVKKIQTFSSGTRKCPGEKLAFYEIFFILGTIIKTYDIQIVTPPEDMTPKRGLTLKPKHYTVSLKRY